MRARSPTVAGRQALPAGRRGGGGAPNTLLLLQAAAGNRATAQLMRQATKAPKSPTDLRMRKPEPPPPVKTLSAEVEPGLPNVMRIKRDDGSEYLVTRVPTPIYQPEGWKKGLGRDQDNVFAYLSYCRRAKGRLEVRADVPKALREYSDGITNALRQGGDVDDVVKAIRTPPKVTGFAGLDFGQSGSWRLSGDASLVLAKGLPEKHGNLKLDFGKWQAEVDATSGQVMFNVKYTGGAPRADCEYELIGITWDYICTMVTPPRKPTGGPPREPKRLPPRRVELYYDWWKSDVNEADPRNADAVKQMRELLRDGYTLRDAVGYASPEGTRTANDKRKWEGNLELSRRRAAKAIEWVDRACVFGHCAAGVEPRAAGELHGTDASGRELTGKELEAHVEGQTQDKPASKVYRTLRKTSLVFRGPVIPDLKIDEDAARRLFCPAEVSEAARIRWRELDPVGLWGTGEPPKKVRRPAR